jgi:hypothetical protein
MAPLASSFMGRLGEFFLLGAAEAQVRRRRPDQQERIETHLAAGDRRSRVGRRVDDPVAACLLMREAARAYVRAAAIASEAHDTTGNDAGVSAGNDGRVPVGRDPGAPVERDLSTLDALARRVAHIPSDPIAPEPRRDLERVRAAIRSPDPLFFESLDGPELEKTRAALDRALSVLRDHAGARSLAAVYGTRYGRMAGVALLLGFALFRVVRTTLWPDLAAGKPVSASSVLPGSPDGHELVEGGMGTSYAIATATQDAPWIAVDLSRVYKITEIDVYNRVDGWFDDNLPLVLETSVDGATWDDVARRDTTFGHDPPWSVRLERRPARYVRIHGVGRMLIALSRLRVYGNR